MNTGGNKVTVPVLPWRNGHREIPTCDSCGLRVAMLFFRRNKWVCRDCKDERTQ